MKVLITGITGFIGSHLAERLLKNDITVAEHEVHGMCRWRSPRDNLVNIHDQIELHEADLLDVSSLIALLEKVEPDQIYHLAAQSYVKTSYSAPIDTLWTNVIGTANLLEAIRITGQNPKILAITSSEVYGQVTTADIPITEDCPLRPHSPYGVSKVGQDMTLFQYGIAYNMRIIRVRNFTTTGPRRGEVFFMSAFAKQIAAILLEKQEPIIRVGNLDSVRTVCDVRDMVEAYIMLCNYGFNGKAYNVGGIETNTVSEYLQMMIDRFFPKYGGNRPAIMIDSDLYRPSDVTLQIPSMDRFKVDISPSWEPRIPIKQTINDMVNHWINELTKYPWKINNVVEG
jgi:GDP-mannose 4,6-dehydratase